MKRIATIFALLLGAYVCMGAVPGPEAANVVTVCSEGCTVTAISSATAVLQFGAGVKWNTITAPALPLLASCLSACPQVGNDPDPSIAKTLVAEQQATAYTVTLAGVSTPITVPALAVSVACALPAAANANPAMPATPPHCSLYPGAVAVATDGQMAALMTSAAPVYLQYCQGSVCDAPFQFITQPLVIGPTALLGGPPGGIGVGTLYVISGARPVAFAVAPAPVVTTTIPAAQ